MKRIISVIICFVLLFASLTFTFADISAADNFERTVIFKASDSSTGYGVVEIVTDDGSKSKLVNSGDRAVLNSGNMTLTVTAGNSCVIREIKINGACKGTYSDAVKVGFSFENLSRDIVVEVTYELVLLKCTHTSKGGGSVTVRKPEYYYEKDQSVLYGDSLVYHVEADEGQEIISLTFDGQKLDLASFGKTSTNKMDSLDLALDQITTPHSLEVVFSGTVVKPKNLTLTVEYDSDKGICNFGNKKVSLESGTDYRIKIQPFPGYKVDRIIDGNTTVDNFSDDYYEISNIQSDRSVIVLFSKISEGAADSTVGADTQVPTESTVVTDTTVAATGNTLDQNDVGEGDLGDANLDGKVNILDVTVVQKAVAGLENLSEEQLDKADVDGDSSVTVKDATLIQKKVAFLITDFPAA